MIFRDRAAAGRQLAEKLREYRGNPNAIVLALPRGGVVVAAQIADELKLPLEVIITRKIGAPQHEEFAIGALSEDGAVFLSENLREHGVSPEYVTYAIEKELAEADRRARIYRAGKRPPDLRGKVVLLVDDGIATGYTMHAAISSAKRMSPSKIIVAVPVAAPDALDELRSEADEIVCLHAPQYFGAVGRFYEEFGQTGDDEVLKLLHCQFAMKS